MKTLLALLLFAATAWAQVQLGGHVYVPSASDSTLGQTAISFTADADCTVATATNCTVTAGSDPANKSAPYNGTFVIGTGTALTTTRKVVLALSPGNHPVFYNNSTGGQIVDICGATGTCAAVPNDARPYLVASDGTNYSLATRFPVGPGSSTEYLNGSGAYTTPSGVSIKVKYVSQLGCAAQNTDLNVGGGTDDTACINTACSTASDRSPVLIWQDGASLISVNGIQCPANGNWAITGNGGGLTQVTITACGVASNVATFTTLPNALAAGDWVTVKQLVNCAAINGKIVHVLSSGLSSTQFEADITTTDVSSAAEAAGLGVSAYGTGFYLASGSGDAISNGEVPVSGNCDIGPGTPPSRGGNISLSNFLINGNSAGQTDYCFGADINNANNVSITAVTFYNTRHYSLKMDNVGDVNVSGNSFVAANAFIGAPQTTDGIHMEGPWNDLYISDDYFNTGDDAIALNANEGYCGPGVRTTITNSTSYSSAEMLRAYNEGVACSNGLIPMVDGVTISNYSGSSYLAVAAFGFDATGTLNPAVTNLTWSNSVVTALGNTFAVDNNLGNISFSHFTVISNDSCFLCSALSPGSNIGQLTLDDVKMYDGSGNASMNLFGATAGGGALTASSVFLDNVGAYNLTGGSISPYCFLCNAQTYIDNLYVSNIDMNLFSSLVTSSYYPSQVQHITGTDGADVWLTPSATTPSRYTTINTYTHNGVLFNPGAGYGDAQAGFMDNAGNYLFSVDLGLDYLWVGTTTGDLGGSGTPTQEPVTIGSGIIGFNLAPGSSTPLYGSVGTWNITHTAAGSLAGDTLSFGTRAYDGSFAGNVLTLAGDKSATFASNVSAPTVTVSSPGGSANGVVNFGPHYGDAALCLYDGGSACASGSYGWGLLAGNDQNFLAGAGMFSWSNGGTLATGSDLMELDHLGLRVEVPSITVPQIIGSGTTFTISGCSATSPVGGSTAGMFASGTTGTCTVTVTFGSSATAPNSWECSVHDVTTPTDVIQPTGYTTTTATFSGTTVTGDSIHFACIAF